VPIGGDGFWTFSPDNAGSHRILDPTPMGLFDSGLRPPGGSYSVRFTAAGQYTIRHQQTGQNSLVHVIPTVKPFAGTTTTQFVLRWATHIPAGFVVDVQISRPGEGYVTWLTGQTTLSEPFVPDDGPGAYRFRSRLRRASNNASTWWSIPVTVNVT
jgi:hypothetical protein